CALPSPRARADCQVGATGRSTSHAPSATASRPLRRRTSTGRPPSEACPARTIRPRKMCRSRHCLSRGGAGCAGPRRPGREAGSAPEATRWRPFRSATRRATAAPAAVVRIRDLHRAVGRRMRGPSRREEEMSEQTRGIDIEASVRERYSAGARSADPGLCCPTAYDARLLAVIPEEALARDYGCGDPTRHLRHGDAALDQGSGNGTEGFMGARVVGRVDRSDDRLEVARRNAPEVARRVGYENTSFRKGKIQDLRLDREWLDELLSAEPVRSETDLARLEGCIEEQRRLRPLVAAESVDVVISNCVLNLVRPEDKHSLFAEIF